MLLLSPGTVRTVFRHRDPIPHLQHIIGGKLDAGAKSHDTMSLKTNIRTAAESSQSSQNTTGLCFIRILIMMIAPIKKRMTCAVCKSPFKGLFFILFTRAIYQIHSRKQSTDEAKKDCKDINRTKVFERKSKQKQSLHVRGSNRNRYINQYRAPPSC